MDIFLLAGKVGAVAQEASVIPAVEKEARHCSSLPMTPCSPAEPPWLSLAKKKAKAWSEMPQIVQQQMTWASFFVLPIAALTPFNPFFTVTIFFEK